MEAKIIMLKGEKGEPGGSTWGNISGTLSNQTDLNTALNEKANISDLGAVAFSNSYEDLNDKPTYATIATTGSYNDLINDSEFIDQSDLQNLLVDLVYPVGSYYWSSNSTNPGTIFGGTWEQIKDKFVLAVGDTYTTVDVTGGEATHTLTVDEIPSHRHVTGPSHFSAYGGDLADIKQETNAAWKTNLDQINTGYTGGGQAHNNMPPYITAYCFHRTA